MTDNEKQLAAHIRAADLEIARVMTRKHTAGPWRLKTNLVTSDNGRIATILYKSTGIETEANGALIAAAPELLAACQRAFHLIDDEDNNPVICKMAGSFGLWLDLKNAIDKANGKEPL